MDGWGALSRAAVEPTRRLNVAIADPAAAQARLLAEILQANAGSEFGTRHGFAGIAGPADFRARVPVAAHDDLRDDIGRIAAGATNVLTTAPVIAFERTGGTASGGKLVPYTQLSLAAFRDAVLPWLGDLAARRPAVTRGRAYVSISPATRRPERTPGGIPVGLASDAAYLGFDLAPAFASLLAVSPDVAGIADVENWRLETLAQLVGADDLAFVSVWSPTFFLGLVEAIPPLADALHPRLDAAARGRLEAALAGPSLDTTALWPALTVISCWADGASKLFAARLGALFPQAVIEPKGVLATEAAVTLPWRDGCVPALTSSFLEFVAADGVVLGAHQLDAGAAYRVLVTTQAGLYRYDLGDVLRCTGHDGRCPRLAFEGRAQLVSDLVGEKLDDAFAAAVLGRLPVAAMLVARALPQPHYELWLDSDDERADALLTQVDAALRANPQYAYARDIGQLGPLQAVPRRHFFGEREQAWLARNKRLGDLKHAALHPDRSAGAPSQFSGEG